MQKVVIDTNVVISAHISKNGNPSKIIELLSDDKIKICYNEKILAEYAEVLSRKKFNFSIKIQNLFINKVKKQGIYITPTISDIILPDETDRIFYDTAKTANAYLITGNMKHYPIDEPFILTPVQFLEMLENNK